MVQIEQIAKAALAGESLRLRSLVQDFFRQHPDLSAITPPQTNDERILAISAALLELFAMRTNQAAPAWTPHVGPLTEPIYLLKSARHMKRLRTLCEQESPEPLRKRSFYAPPDYLTFA
jgi:hypothetical protein